MQALDFRGQEDDGLPGGIPAADQRHLLALAQPRLDRRGPVGDARAFEDRQVRDVRLPVARAGGGNDGTGEDGAAVRQFQAQRIADPTLAAAAIQPRDFQRYGDLRAEFCA
jgi:hypothetical protein